jgi:hypothetical protein
MTEALGTPKFPTIERLVETNIQVRKGSFGYTNVKPW